MSSADEAASHEGYKPADPDDLYDAEVTDLFRAHAGRLSGYLRNLGSDSALVDDIVQDSFLALRRRWHDVRSYDKPQAYLYQVATNRMRRLHKNRYVYAEPHPEPRLLSDQSLHEPDRDSLPQIQASLRQLPPRQHEVVLLRHLYGFSCQETAEILQISEGTVKSHLFMALRRLAELLKADPDSWEGER